MVVTPTGGDGLTVGGDTTGAAVVMGGGGGGRTAVVVVAGRVVSAWGGLSLIVSVGRGGGRFREVAGGWIGNGASEVGESGDLGESGESGDEDPSSVSSSSNTLSGPSSTPGGMLPSCLTRLMNLRRGWISIWARVRLAERRMAMPVIVASCGAAGSRACQRLVNEGTERESKSDRLERPGRKKKKDQPRTNGEAI